MTIALPPNRQVFTGPGDSFGYTRPVFEQDGADVYVAITDDSGVTFEPEIGGVGDYDFQISGTYDTFLSRYPNGVTVLLNTSLPNDGWKISIECRPLLRQLTQYTNGGDLDQGQLETDFDRRVVSDQAIQAQLDDCFKVPPTAGAIDTTLPSPNAGKALVWNATADAIVNSDDDINGIVAAATAQAVIATTQAGIATSQAGIATTQAGNSSASAALSQGWAITPEDTPVPNGGGGFSALHWAKKAQAAAGLVDGTRIESPDTSSGAEAKDGGLFEITAPNGLNVNGFDLREENLREQMALQSQVFG